MAILKANHYYVLKKSRAKLSRYINSIMPIEDREVPDSLFNDYDDLTEIKSKHNVSESKNK